MDYKKAIEEIKNSLKSELGEIQTNRRTLKQISFDDYKELLKLTGEVTLRKIGAVETDGKPKEYVFTDKLKPVIVNLYEYLIGKKYHINSGIALCGFPGAGKTVLIVSFLNLMVKIGSIKGWRHINARTYHKIEDKSKYETGVLFIEEFGKNPQVVKDYGTEEKPIQNLLMKRYETRQITFIDSNLDESALVKAYDELIEDRFRDMLNFIYITRPDKSNKHSLRGK